MDFKLKILITVGIILVFLIYLVIDKKYRKKVINKTKRKVKKEFIKQFKK